ncbi:MAG: hypothetical protein PSX80_09295 [bacterium]|nr:hypothetical protein [bacterium]
MQRVQFGLQVSARFYEIGVFDKAGEFGHLDISDRNDRADGSRLMGPIETPR